MGGSKGSDGDDFVNIYCEQIKESQRIRLFGRCGREESEENETTIGNQKKVNKQEVEVFDMLCFATIHD